MNYVNKGQAVSADHTNSIVDAISRNTPNNGGNTILTSGAGGFSISTLPEIERHGTNSHENGFHLGFLEDSAGSLSVYVLASFVTIAEENIIPTLNDEPIAEEKATEEFELVKQSISEAGNYEFWVEIDTAAKTAKIHIDLEDDITKTSDYYKYGAFVIESVGEVFSVKSYDPYIKRSVSIGGGAEKCILGDLIPIKKETEESTQKYEIRAGYITGGSDAAILLENKFIEPTDGDLLYIEANIEIEVEDEVLLNRFTINSADIIQAPTQPDNHEFTADSATGKVFFTVGEWENIAEDGDTEDLKWKRDGCGSFRVKMCDGQAIMVRG